jgi:hypothetical protein
MKCLTAIRSMSFNPHCRLKSDISRGPRSATSRHMQGSKRTGYSITSSARASSIGGTGAERPSCPVRSSARQLRPSSSRRDGIAHVGAPGGCSRCSRPKVLQLDSVAVIVSLCRSM